MPTGSPAPPPSRHSRPVTVLTRDGLHLAGTSRAPAPPATPRADVVLVHGYAEHGGRYGELVDLLVGRGLACHLLDLRGHGRSEGPRGHVRRFEDYRDDLARFLERLGLSGGVRPDDPGRRAARRPTLLLGHSLGGLICLDLLLHGHHRAARFGGLVLSSPYMAPVVPLAPLVRLLARALSRLTPTVRLPLVPPPEDLSRDPRVVAAYAADPLVVRTVTPRWAAEVLEAQHRVLARADAISLPTLVLAGSADPIADPDRTRTLFDRLGSEDKRLRVYDGFLHEVLNEQGRERVLSDLLAWIEERLT